MPISLVGLEKADLVAVLVQMSETCGIAEMISDIDAYEDPITMGSALSAAVQRIYRETKDVSRMVAVGKAGVAYCLRRAALGSDGGQTFELRRLGKPIAYNTAANCWPGWDDAGGVIEDAQIRDGIELTARCRELVHELSLTPREAGGADWLVGALQLAVHEYKAAQEAFEQAERAFASDDDLLPYALMARGYVALAQKSDPQGRKQGSDALDKVLEQLRAEGSDDGMFFANQIATADRVFNEERGVRQSYLGEG